MRQPKVTFQMLVYNDDYVLDPCLKAILPYAHAVVVTEGPVAHYWQNTTRDSTCDILAFRVGEENVVHGQWEEKDEMQRAAEHLIPDDTDYVWLVDADEVWPARVIKEVFDMLAGGVVDGASFHANSFFGGFEHVMTGFEEMFEVHRIQRWHPGATWETHRPPTVRMRDGRRCRDGVYLHAPAADTNGWRFFHYSYVFPSQARKKSAYYEARAAGMCIPRWYERVYLPWVRGDVDTRDRIEDEFLGVHNWTPEARAHEAPKCRGECYTEWFCRDHPDVINEVMPALKARFNLEMQEV